MRRFRCRECGGEKTTDTTMGPLPSVCDECDPERAALRVAHRARSRDGARRRAGELQRLRDRVAELEAALRFDEEARRRMPSVRASREETGRDVLGRMVRRLAFAEGRRATYEALLDVSAARSWARSLAEGDEERAAL